MTRQVDAVVKAATDLIEHGEWTAGQNAYWLQTMGEGKALYIALRNAVAALATPTPDDRDRERKDSMTKRPVLRLTGAQLASIDPPVSEEWFIDADEHEDFVVAPTPDDRDREALVEALAKHTAYSLPEWAGVIRQIAAEGYRIVPLSDDRDREVERIAAVLHEAEKHRWHKDPFGHGPDHIDRERAAALYDAGLRASGGNE